MSADMPPTDTQKKPASGDWHPADIKAALEKKGFSLRGFARAHHYRKSAVSKAMRHPYPVIEALIARELGVDVTTIWPSRYDANGVPFRGRPAVNSTYPGRVRNVSDARPS